MHRPLHCICLTSPAPDDAGYLGAFEVYDADGNALVSGRDETVYPRMQQALESARRKGRQALVLLEKTSLTTASETLQAAEPSRPS